MRIDRLFQALPGLVFTLFVAQGAHAQLFRAYVASTGSDANPCTLVAPCRLLPAALAAVADGGEIWMLDTANYNTDTVTITKSVSIGPIPGVTGSVVVTGNFFGAMRVTQPVNLVLRNVVVAQLPGANTAAVQLDAAATLDIIDCRFEGLSGWAIFTNLYAAKVRIMDSLFRGTDGVVVQGGTSLLFERSRMIGGTIKFNHGAADATLVVRDSTITDSVRGIDMDIGTGTTALTRAHVVRTTVQRASDAGISLTAPSPRNVDLTVTDSEVLDSGVGVRTTGTGARVLMSRNVIAGNGTGFLQASSSVFESAGNNTMRYNTADFGGTITSLPSAVK